MALEASIEFDRGVECSYCMETLDDPVYLISAVDERGQNCSHNFCFSCLFELPTNGYELAKKSGCPVCRQIPVAFARNRALSSALARLAEVRIARDEMSKRLASVEAQAAAQGRDESERCERELKRVKEELSRCADELNECHARRDDEKAQVRERLASVASQVAQLKQVHSDEKVALLDEVERQRIALIEAADRVADAEQRIDAEAYRAASLEDARYQRELEHMHAALQKREMEVDRWQRMYEGVLDDLKVKEREVEVLKRRAKERDANAADGASGGDDDRSIVSWLSGWLKGGDVRVSAAGALLRSLEQFALFERRGAALCCQVYRAQERTTGDTYALKRIAIGAATPELPRLRTYASACREAMLMRRLGHDNVLSLRGVCHWLASDRPTSGAVADGSSALIPSSSSSSSAGGVGGGAAADGGRDAMLTFASDMPDCNQLVLVTDYMEYDLEFMIASNRVDSESVIRNVMWQLLKAVHCMHHCEVVHRGVSPSAVLLDERYKVKLGSLSNARSLYSQPLDRVAPDDSGDMRCWAPELVLFMNDFTKGRPTSAMWRAIDMWAIGCVFAEMLLGEPLFVGDSHLHLLEGIVRVDELRPSLGRASADVDRFPLLKTALNVVASRGSRTYSLARHIASHATLRSPTGPSPPSRAGIDLLFRLLRYDATDRIGAAEALNHAFFSDANFGAPARLKSIANFVTDDEIVEFSLHSCGIRL
jgi:serine/threonine protein kinase